MQMRIARRAFLAMLTSAALVLSLGAMVGCSSPVDDEKIVREVLTSELDQFKNIDEQAMEELVSAVEDGANASDLAQLEAMGISGKDFVETMFEGFDYTIGDIAVNGNAATANVVVKAKNFSEFVTGATDLMSSILDDPSQFASMSQEEIMTAVGDRIKGMLADLPLAENDLELDLQKKDGIWEPSSSTSKMLGSVFFN